MLLRTLHIAVVGLQRRVCVGCTHLQRSRYVSVTLTDGSGIAGFYQRFGFRVCKDVAQIWERGQRPSAQMRTARDHEQFLATLQRSHSRRVGAACRAQDMRRLEARLKGQLERWMG